MNLSYKEAEKFLFEQLPVFQNIGGDAYKPGLGTSEALDSYFGHPHRSYKTVHIAGTNGKGSVSNFIASVLQEAGYRTGLFTSPHILDFRERIRVNGQMISQDYVADFVNHHVDGFMSKHPSFFELTSAMCFQYFKDQKVDVGVIEVGMGGRLDSTNIITPLVSVVTNIAFDHVQFLGDTLKAIAGEKAGIIKRGVPVVVGESDTRTNSVFMDKANSLEAPIILASNKMQAVMAGSTDDGKMVFNVFKCGSPYYSGLKCGQTGKYQEKNIVTALAAIEQLQQQGLSISRDNIYAGFENVNRNTGFFGRWQTIQQNPLVICDTGHNCAGLSYTVPQIEAQPCRTLRMVIGFVKDKDISGILRMLPQKAVYYFCNANIKRALPAAELRDMAMGYGLDGEAYPSVREAVEAAKNAASKDDFIFIGGSNFIVAEAI